MHEVELKKSVNRMKKGECLVIPVMFQDCTLDSSLPFYNLNRVPRDGKPICKFKPQLQGCTEATNMIKEMIDKAFPGSRRKSRNSKSKSKELSVGMLCLLICIKKEIATYRNKPKVYKYSACLY